MIQAGGFTKLSYQNQGSEYLTCEVFNDQESVLFLRDFIHVSNENGLLPLPFIGDNRRFWNSLDIRNFQLLEAF